MPRQDLPRRRTGARRHLAGRRTRHRLRAARPQRGRQVDDREGAHDALAARRGQRARRGARRPARPRVRAARDRRRQPEARRRRGGHGAREPHPAGAGAGPAHARRPQAGGRAAGALRPRRRRAQARPDVLGRHAAAPGHRDGPRAPPAGAVPRRADDRPGSGGARRDLGRDRRARDGRGADDPPHHALPGGGRPARVAARVHRPRARRRDRQPHRAQGGAARRRDPRRAPRRGRGPLGARRPGAGPRHPRDRPRRPRAARARRRGRGRGARRARRPRLPRPAGGLGHRGAAVPGRRLPAPHRGSLRSAGAEEQAA